MNPFLGELNSLLKNRSPEGHGAEAPRRPPKPTGPKPKLVLSGESPHPGAPSPRPSPGPAAATPSPNASPVAASACSDERTLSSNVTAASSATEAPPTERKGSFLDELKKKIFLGPPSKTPETKKDEVDLSAEKVETSEEKENVVPTLTHEVAKHKLLVRPKKTHRLSYAEFRKSRLLQESPTEEEPERDILRQISETETNKDLPNPVAPPRKDSKDGSIDREDAGSPGYSSADNSEDHSFRTPPESPSFYSEIGQNESTTSDFYSVSSEPLSPSEGDFPCLDEVRPGEPSVRDSGVFGMDVVFPSSDDTVFTSEVYRPELVNFKSEPAVVECESELAETKPHLEEKLVTEAPSLDGKPHLEEKSVTETPALDGKSFKSGLKYASVDGKSSEPGLKSPEISLMSFEADLKSSDPVLKSP